MIVFADSATYPLNVQGGDVLFIAGCLSTKQIPFEHVVLAAETRKIGTVDEFLDLKVYGLPESGEARFPACGLDLSNARWWLRRKAIVRGQIGSNATVWNLGGRLDGVDAETAHYMLDVLSFKAGSVSFGYSTEFRVDPELASPLETNCLGFVCSVFEYMGFTVLAHNFPQYKSPYHQYPGNRKHPSPGHLARAMKLGAQSHPYRAPTGLEARKYAPAMETLREALSKT